MQELDGKVAAITGGASGIGRALAEAFGAAGMKVVLADIETGPLDAGGRRAHRGRRRRRRVGVRRERRRRRSTRSRPRRSSTSAPRTSSATTPASAVRGGLTWEVPLAGLGLDDRRELHGRASTASARSCPGSSSRARVTSSTPRRSPG